MKSILSSKKNGPLIAREIHQGISIPFPYGVYTEIFFFSLQSGSVFLILAILGCQGTEPTAMVDIPTGKESTTNENAGGNLKSGILKSGCLLGEPIAYKEIDGDAVFMGDMILSPEQLRCPDTTAKPTGAARSAVGARWPYNKVYYNFAPGFSGQDIVMNAISQWESHTKIRFLVRQNEQNWITFSDDGSDCKSFVGMQGGNQTVKLPGCSTGNTIHEIGHALGLYHEQMRAARDNDIIMHPENADPASAVNFKTYLQLSKDGFDQGPFDFGSIMLYGSYFYSKNGLPTMTKKDGSTFGSQRTAPSAGDISLINFLYPQPWNLLPGQARDIGVGANGTAWIIGSTKVGSAGDYNIARWTGSGWITVGGGGVRIDVDPAGNPWVVNASHGIYYWNGTSFLHMPGNANDIGIGADGSVFIISNTLYSNKKDFYIQKWNGSSWVTLPGAGVRISADQSGHPWVVNSSGTIYAWSGSSWVLQPGMASDIGIGTEGSVFITSTTAIPGTHDYYFEKQSTYGWVLTGGAGVSIDAGPGGVPWGTNSSLSVYNQL